MFKALICSIFDKTYIPKCIARKISPIFPIYNKIFFVSVTLAQAKDTKD